MPDLFDNFFNRINMAVNGKSRNHYSGSSQVNTGLYYNYVNTPTNSNYWMSTSSEIKQSMDPMNALSEDSKAPRMERNMSVSSEASDEKSRHNSVVE